MDIDFGALEETATPIKFNAFGDPEEAAELLGEDDADAAVLPQNIDLEEDPFF